MTAQTLAPASLPLWGSRLIEASAGTGKTWTIAALYLRLVLGHGSEDAFERPLQPSEILVMTFTVAATRELSDRIRKRLIEAARVFRSAPEAAAVAGQATGAPAIDPLLSELLAAYPLGPDRSFAAWRLEMAAQAMDDAAVFTIDAWCQRMLREHAFDSGCLFDEELSPNESVMLAEAARDYWRQQVYPLTGTALDAVLTVWPDAERLADEAPKLVEQPWPAQTGAGSLQNLLACLLEQRGAELVELKQGWVERVDQMSNWLGAQLDSPSCPFNKSRLGAKNCQRWLSALGDWATHPSLEKPDLKSGAWRFTPAGMHEALKAGKTVDLPQHFDAFDSLMQALEIREPLSVSLRPHAALQIAARLAEIKQQAGRFGFADMLNRLDRALDPTINGGNAERLRSNIISRYPVALIDEFQDTSPVQLRIFDRLYRIADNDRNTALLLIGDPKQSIYRFRGADIHSYLSARRNTEGRHYMLATNHRSTEPLVAAVNFLFSQSEARHYLMGQGSVHGAFMYAPPPAERTPSFTLAPVGAASAAIPPQPATTQIAAEAAPTRDSIDPDAPATSHSSVGAASAAIPASTAASREDANPLPFVEVQARGRTEHLLDSSGPIPAMQLILESGAGDATGIRRRFAQRCAEQIATLLNDAQAGFHDAERGFKRLHPADIAVLVRTGLEAVAVRRELQRRRVASVYLSDQDSVFASGEAADILFWLRAVAQPLDVRLARAALATRTIGLPIAELLRLASDDEAFDARSEQLASLHTVWQSQGVLTMLRRSLHMFELPARWLAAPLGTGAEAASQTSATSADHIDGERRLTNFLHLAELLQAASASLDGEQALIRWLAAQIDADAVGDDEQIVRLESDADLVQIITVHKSKGLEYPLVFVPFASGFRAVEKRDTLFVDLVDATTGERQIHLDPTPAQIDAADLDRQREDLRLLYVAMTRARHGLWIGLAALSDRSGKSNLWHRSAAGHLLGNGQPVDADALPADLDELVAGCNDNALTLRVVAATDAIACSPLQPRGKLQALCETADYRAEFERSWRIASFSAMVRDLPATVSKMAADAQLHDDETEVVEPDTVEISPQSLQGGSDSTASTTIDLFADEPWHKFPRGSVPGNFLHDQLEWLATENFALASSPGLQQQLLQRCERQGWGHRARAVLDWLGVLVRTPLPPLDAALDAIAAPLPEMEFWFSSDGLDAEQVDSLCRRHLLSGRDRPVLPRRELNGLLMGFADLVFEHRGRYWVLDYKSNWLGDGDAAYTPDTLESAMASHRYDVQAAIYLLALHRLLRSRLGASYDPARQLGGAIYLFLRGINGPTRGCHLIGPSVELLDELDALLMAQSEAAK